MKKRKIIQIVLFLSILFLGVVGSGRVIQAYTNRGILNVKKDTVDYFVFGDSEAYTSLSPMNIYNTHGYTGYNFGVSSQYVQNSYFDFVNAMKHQKPKVVLIETNFLFRAKASTDIVSSRFDFIVKNYFNIVDNHNGWKSLLKGKKAEGVDAEAVNKGFKIKFESKPYVKGIKSVAASKVVKIPESSISYVKQIIDDCKENDIKVVFYSAPSPVNWSQEKHRAVADFAKAQNIEYLDFNIENRVAIDWNKDTYDAGDHLNYYGAEKISQYIGDYLKTQGHLEDRRSNNEYSQWVNDYEIYKKSIHSN